MKINHIHENNFASHLTSKKIAFLLTNKKGSYFTLGIDSKYSGFFYYLNGRMFKIIDNLVAPGYLREVTNNIYNIERKRGHYTESFFLPYNKSSLVYQSEDVNELDLYLDIRESYDNRQWGRFYEIKEKDGCIVIKFVKKTDSREDNSHNKLEYRLFLAIYGANLEYQKIEEWLLKRYAFDEARGDTSERYVYFPLKLRSNKFVFSVSNVMTKAVKEAKNIFSNLHRYVLFQKQQLKLIMKDLKDIELNLAYVNALNSLSSLIVDKGMFAGLPWFFQFWARDEIISLKAVMSDRRFATSIIDKYITGINHLFKSHPKSRIKSADALGWYFLRVRDYMEIYDLSAIKKKQIINLLKKSIEILLKKNTSYEGFAVNNALETWMDTSINHTDTREGVRIEIQALRLFMYNFMYVLTKDETYKKLEESLRRNVRNRFWKNGYLKDGIDDSTIRPNVFIAAYVYPSLLYKEEWISCFKKALKALWLPWGGLASIDKKHEFFKQNYTGLDNCSYHRGDSWYWINCLAALVMYRIDKKTFHDYINKIIRASVKDILYQGYVGHASELSDAVSQNAQANYCQAWSNAMFIELIDEIYG
ncbi:hypothetical protein DRJ17_03815 [Candidatus Woesearchaeota archaeon]|nr:MAG: hypothetical protein DRJ17_03815 [Candidatus Woesearchaeota archaeon]